MNKPLVRPSDFLDVVEAIRNGSLSVQSMCNDLEIKLAILFRWYMEYTRLERLHHKRVQELEEENRRLRRMLVDLQIRAES